MEVPQIDIEDAARQIAGGVPIIDVREPEEYDAGHVPGASLIPLGSIEDRVAEVPRSGPVLIICRSGARSNHAAERLRALGINALNIDGGTLAWVDSGREVVTAGGAVGSGA